MWKTVWKMCKTQQLQGFDRFRQRYENDATGTFLEDDRFFVNLF